MKAKRILLAALCLMLVSAGGERTIQGAMKKPGKPSGVMATAVKRTVVLSWIKGKKSVGDRDLSVRPAEEKVYKKGGLQSVQICGQGVKARRQLWF